MTRSLIRGGLFAAICIATGALAATETTVVQKDKKFSADEVTVKAGDSVVFKNDDPITHNVFSQTPGMSFELKTQKAGESSAIKFDKAGVAEVRCAIHPQMKMRVKVE